MNVEYKDGNTVLRGYLAKPVSLSGKVPAVIVVHDWTGRNEFACKKAQLLADAGYMAFALDMYGEGKTGATKEEKMQLMQPLMEDRSLLARRMQAALETVKSFPEVDSNKIAAIGFCFGGLCVLDLARSGADVAGVVSFHGLLGAPEPHKNAAIKAKILVLHGYDDPMVQPDQVTGFASEMTSAKVDWQIHMYSNTMHAFTNPLANDPDFGTVYNKVTDKRSWQAMKDFFAEIL